MWRRHSARMWWPYAVALVGIVTFSMVRPGVAQNTCTTNYCVKSQSISFQTPSGWPSVTIQTCCRTRWGVLPNGMDWSNGTPVMLCTGNANYATEYPNCGAPSDLSQDFPRRGNPWRLLSSRLLIDSFQGALERFLDGKVGRADRSQQMFRIGAVAAVAVERHRPWRG